MNIPKRKHHRKYPGRKYLGLLAGVLMLAPGAVHGFPLSAASPQAARDSAAAGGLEFFSPYPRYFSGIFDYYEGDEVVPGGHVPPLWIRAFPDHPLGGPENIVPDDMPDRNHDPRPGVGI